MIVLYTMYILMILKYKSMQIKTVLPQNWYARITFRGTTNKTCRSM